MVTIVLIESHLLFTRLLSRSHSKLLMVASVVIAAIFVACGSGETAATPVAEVSTLGSTHLVTCVLSGPSSEFPERAVPGLDVIPTALDGVNTAVCTFPEVIVAVTVTLFHVEGPLAGFKAISESTAVEANFEIEFPISPQGEQEIISSLLPLGRYVRKMEGVTGSGELIEIQTGLNQVATEVFLVDAPNATTFSRTGGHTGSRIFNERSPGKNG